MSAHGAAHPLDPTVFCDVDGDNHPTCTGRKGEPGMFATYLDWINLDYVPPKVIKAASAKELRDRLGRTAAKAAPAVSVLDQPEPEGFAAGVKGSERAAGKWTDGQTALVDAAIEKVARQHAGGGEFTADAIWDELGGKVPVTKGLTARLMRADRRRIIGNTGKTEISQRGGHHDHGQRLTVWYSLISK